MFCSFYKGFEALYQKKENQYKCHQIIEVEHQRHVEEKAANVRWLNIKLIFWAAQGNGENTVNYTILIRKKDTWQFLKRDRDFRH